MSKTPFRPYSQIVLVVVALLFAGMAFSQDKPDRPPWAQKTKSAKSSNSTSTSNASSTPTLSPNATPDGEPGKIVQSMPAAPADNSQDTASQRGRSRVNVNLVNVLVSVLDEKNRPAR